MGEKLEIIKHKTKIIIDTRTHYIEIGNKVSAVLMRFIYIVLWDYFTQTF